MPTEDPAAAGLANSAPREDPAARRKQEQLRAATGETTDEKIARAFKLPVELVRQVRRGSRGRPHFDSDAVPAGLTTLHGGTIGPAEDTRGDELRAARERERPVYVYVRAGDSGDDEPVLLRTAEVTTARGPGEIETPSPARIAAINIALPIDEQAKMTFVLASGRQVQATVYAMHLEGWALRGDAHRLPAQALLTDIHPDDAGARWTEAESLRERNLVPLPRICGAYYADPRDPPPPNSLPRRCERLEGHDGAHTTAPTQLFDESGHELSPAQVELRERRGQTPAYQIIDDPPPASLREVQAQWCEAHGKPTAPTPSAYDGPWTKLQGNFRLRDGRRLPNGSRLTEVWLPAIPMPMLGLRQGCSCGRRFWTRRGYEAHYALEHILESRETRASSPPPRPTVAGPPEPPVPPRHRPVS